MNNHPSSDVWRLMDCDKESQNYRQKYKFDFSFFDSEEIKEIVKEYIWMNYRTGNRVPKGLRESLWRLKYFNTFCNQEGICTLLVLSNSIADDYRSFLRVYLSSVTGKSLSYAYQYNCFSALKTLVNWCRIFMPDTVPEKQIFTGNEYRNVYGSLKISFIPDEILQTLNSLLKVEENYYLKHGITIMECTGMRIGDLLLLQTDCISRHPISGYTISWFDHKNRKTRKNMIVPVECKKSVDRLNDITKLVRKKATEAERSNLFIYEPKVGAHKKPIITISKQTFAKWLRNFNDKHNICDANGNVFKIKSHMFRRTLATDMLSKGTNIKVIQKVLGHSSPATTKKYYADVKDVTQAKMFSKIGILGNINNVSATEISTQSELLWFKDNCNAKARLSDGYCTLPVKESKPCGHFLSRQKCYLCSRYITTLEDLETHKSHLSDLQDMLDSNIYGAHYAAHIVPTTIALKEIIRRLEEMKNEK